MPAPSRHLSPTSFQTELWSLPLLYMTPVTYRELQGIFSMLLRPCRSGPRPASRSVAAPDAALEHAPLLYDARYISRAARDFFRALAAMSVCPRIEHPCRR